MKTIYSFACACLLALSCPPCATRVCFPIVMSPLLTLHVLSCNHIYLLLSTSRFCVTCTVSPKSCHASSTYHSSLISSPNLLLPLYHSVDVSVFTLPFLWLQDVLCLSPNRSVTSRSCIASSSQAPGAGCAACRTDTPHAG